MENPKRQPSPRRLVYFGIFALFLATVLIFRSQNLPQDSFATDTAFINAIEVNLEEEQAGVEDDLPPWALDEMSYGDSEDDE